MIWFHKAAEQGVAEAQRYLGVMYSKGQGVPKDFQQAIVWYRKAAEQRDLGGAISTGIDIFRR